jgi:hypothetical protein
LYADLSEAIDVLIKNANAFLSEFVPRALPLSLLLSGVCNVGDVSLQYFVRSGHCIGIVVAASVSFTMVISPWPWSVLLVSVLRTVVMVLSLICVFLQGRDLGGPLAGLSGARKIGTREEGTGGSDE